MTLLLMRKLSESNNTLDAEQLGLEDDYGYTYTYYPQDDLYQDDVRNVYNQNRPLVAIGAMLGVVMVLVLVVLLAIRLEPRCLNEYNRRRLAIQGEDDDKKSMEEKESYIRSILRTLKLSSSEEAKGSTLDEEHEIPSSTPSQQLELNHHPRTKNISNLRSRSSNTNANYFCQFIGSEECAICFYPYEEGDVICISPNQNCPHFYHAECMISWLSRNDSCPKCRQDYLKEQEVNVTTLSSGSTSESDGNCIEDVEQGVLDGGDHDDGEDEDNIFSSSSPSSLDDDNHLITDIPQDSNTSSACPPDDDHVVPEVTSVSSTRSDRSDSMDNDDVERGDHDAEIVNH